MPLAKISPQKLVKGLSGNACVAGCENGEMVVMITGETRRLVCSSCGVEVNSQQAFLRYELREKQDNNPIPEALRMPYRPLRALPEGQTEPHIVRTPIDGLLIMEGNKIVDERGWFMEKYKRDWLEPVTGPIEYVQDNVSQNLVKGTLRGLHLAPHGKRTFCVRGDAFVAAADFRRGSPTYGERFSMILYADSPESLCIPPGFAHGYQALTDGTQYAYAVTRQYDPARPNPEVGIAWDDPDLNIPWIIDNPTLSPKDQKSHSFREIKALAGVK